MPGPNFFNSKEYEWSDVRLYIAGARVQKVTGVRYKMKQEKEYLYAEGNKVIGIQEGNFVPEGSITLLRGAIDDLNAAARAAGGQNLLNLEFDIVVKFLASADGSRQMITNTLVRCQFTEYETALKQNDKKQEVELPIMYFDQSDI